MRFQDLLFHYTNGLSEKVKYEVMSKDPKTLDAALAIATQFEHLHSRNPVDVNTMSVRPRHTNANTHRFPNHNANSNGRRSHSSNVQVPQLVCSYCHKKGHVINDC